MPLIEPQQEWVAFYSHGDSYVISSAGYGKTIGIEIQKDGQVINTKPTISLAPHIINNSNESIRLLQYSWKLPDSKLFLPAGYYIKDGSYKIDLIYGGKLNNIIEIISREYIDDFTRTARQQSFKYDLTNGDIISYRTIKIQVIEAMDSKITFKVVEDGGLPWVLK
jgi:hypothetical protein